MRDNYYLLRVSYLLCYSYLYWQNAIYWMEIATACSLIDNNKDCMYLKSGLDLVGKVEGIGSDEGILQNVQFDVSYVWE